MQEALTNTLKHAGPARAEVAIRYRRRRCRARDRTTTAAGQPDTANGGGHGLVGMRERATLYGGELSAGARDGGGFVVRARLPIPTSES